MSRIPPESLGSAQTANRRPTHRERDSSEELARLLGGIGAPTESHSLSARMAAAIDDLGSGCG